MRAIIIFSILFIASINCATLLPIDTAFVKSDRVGNDFSYSVQENRGVLAAALDPLPALQPQIQQQLQQLQQQQPLLNKQAIIPQTKLSIEQQQQLLQQPGLQQNSLGLAAKLTPLQPALPLQSLALTSTLPISYIPSTQYAYAYPYPYPIAYNLIKS